MTKAMRRLAADKVKSNLGVRPTEDQIDSIFDLFDAAFYTRHYPDVGGDPEAAFRHFVTRGWSEMRCPHALFDSRYYFQHNPDVRDAAVNPLFHYVIRGAQERRQPHPLFDLSYYLAGYSEVQESGEEPLGYYLKKGWLSGHRPNQLFDPEWYAGQAMGGQARQAPLAHYAEYGAKGGTPHPLFDCIWYLEQYPDVAASGIDPLTHYLTVGFREKRLPHPAFDAVWYKDTYKDVAAAERNPLIHYLESCATERRDPNPVFSTAWYLEKYVDVSAAGINPLVHYLETGWKEGRDPSPHFSTRNYLECYAGDVAFGQCPLVHYLVSGKFSGYTTAPALLPPEAPASYIPFMEHPSLGADKAARAVAFYLPQFHAIPENDAWWGKGFTEWTNVRSAQAQYEGHYQPREPGEMGYYDLCEEPSTMRRQAELAANYGIEAFCFYFYWFGGKRLLEKPIETFAEDPEIQLPFCLCWANENWTRRWDGLDHEMLIGQSHSPDDDIAFIVHLAQYLRNPRYLRIEGRPVVLVYRPSLLPDAAATANRWRKWCREAGIGEIYLVYTQSFDKIDPRDIGFDAATEFPPNNSNVPELSGHLKGMKDTFAGKLYDWRALANSSKRYVAPSYKLFRGVNPSWDNTARRKSGGTILYGANPAEYSAWTERAAADTRDRFPDPSERLLFINAWNEWAEGACLEPDARYGYAWLEATYSALHRAS